MFLRYLQGCVNSCYHLLTLTGINCCVLNFSCLAPCCCRPAPSVYLCLERNLSKSLVIIDFHSFFLLVVICNRYGWFLLIITFSLIFWVSSIFDVKYVIYLQLVVVVVSFRVKICIYNAKYMCSFKLYALSFGLGWLVYIQ